MCFTPRPTTQRSEVHVGRGVGGEGYNLAEPRSRVVVLFRRVAALFRRVAVLFRGVAVLFRGVVVLFRRVVVLFRRVVVLFRGVAVLFSRGSAFLFETT